MKEKDSKRPSNQPSQKETPKESERTTRKERQKEINADGRNKMEKIKNRKTDVKISNNY
jgi:hypothetical protein